MPDDFEEFDSALRARIEQMWDALEEDRTALEQDAHRLSHGLPLARGANGARRVLALAERHLDSASVRLERIRQSRRPAPPAAAAESPAQAPPEPPRSLWERLEDAEPEPSPAPERQRPRSSQQRPQLAPSCPPPSPSNRWRVLGPAIALTLWLGLAIGSCALLR